MECVICGEEARLVSRSSEIIDCECARCGRYQAFGEWFQGGRQPAPVEAIRDYFEMQRAENPETVPVISSNSAFKLYILSRIVMPEPHTVRRGTQRLQRIVLAYLGEPVRYIGALASHVPEAVTSWVAL